MVMFERNERSSVADSAGVAELRASLGEYLARVKAGGEVVVMEDGRPIARLVPVKLEEDAKWERLREMERKGEVRIGAGGVPDEFFEMKGAEDPEGKVRAALIEEREEGW